jgi:23S rRNA (guanosine2251-2'-O)-methyltransferase
MSDAKDMIYGTRAVMEALLAGRTIDKILMQKGLTGDNAQELIQKARSLGIPLQTVPAEKLGRLTRKNHQGVICFLTSATIASLPHLIARAYEEGRHPFFLILDRVTDVRNFGAIARTAECAGADALVISERGNAPLSADAMKTSSGALNHLPVCRERDLRDACRTLKESGIQIVACTEKGTGTLFGVDLTRPTALLLGSEEDGISNELLREADVLARIPMRGSIGSLNVSVAAGIALYEVVRQQGGS